MKALSIAVAALLLCADYSFAQVSNLALPVQDARSTAKNGGGSQTSKNPKQCQINPKSCQPTHNGGGKGGQRFCPNCPAPGTGGGGGTSGGGDPGDPLIYSQEPVPIIYQNLAWSGPTPYTGPNASPGNSANCNYTLFATSGGTPQNGNFIPYVYGNFIPDASASSYTGYAGDGDTNAIGTAGSPPIILQGDGAAGGSTTGIIMAPQVLGFGWDHAVLVDHNFNCGGVSGQPQPWSNGYVGFQINTNLAVPYVFQQIVDNQIGIPGQNGHQGISFFYFTIVLQNTVDTTQIIYIAPRVFQTHELDAGEAISVPAWIPPFGEAGPGVAVNDTGSFPILFARLGIDTSIITNCGTFTFTASFSGMGPSTICAQMSAAQLTAAITLINASSASPRHNYDTTASNWSVLLINQDYETWTHSGGDQRLGMSPQGFQFWIQ